MKPLVPFANFGDADADFLDGPRDFAVDLNVIAHFHLIFKDDEEPGDQVADQVLGAKSDRQPQNSRAGQDGRRIDSDVEQEGEGGDEIDGVPGEGFDQLAQGQRFFPVDPLELEYPVDQFARKPQRHISEEENQHNSGQGKQQGVHRVVDDSPHLFFDPFHPAEPGEIGSGILGSIRCGIHGTVGDGHVRVHKFTSVAA